ncbi:MAG: LamG domain-containing protein, partial [Sediminibacterium sp.]|nr:LamG domain-containing protein [Sediminibacterium sp.]
KIIATSAINADSSQLFRVRINSLKPILSYSVNPVRIDQGISDSLLPTINATGLPIRYKIIGSLVTGISIDSISGVIKWTSKVIPNIYSFIVQAQHSVDSAQTNFTLQINQIADTILYFSNSAFQSTTSSTVANGDYINLPNLNLDSNYTVETWFNLNANTGTTFPFIYNLGGWNNTNSNGLILTANRTLSVKSWGAEANQAPPNNLTGNMLVAGTWTHLAIVVKGRNTKVYVNGNLIKEYTSLGNTPTNNNTFINNRIGNGQDAGVISTTLGQYRDFRIWKKARISSEIQATYRSNVLRNSDGLYYYLPLDDKLFTTRNIGNNTTLSNYSTATGALNGASAVISQNGGTGAKYFTDTTNQRVSGKYKDSLLTGETIQISYDNGITWRAVKYAANNNWYDSLVSVFNGGVIKVRSVIGGVTTGRYFADFIQYIKPTAPQLNYAASYEVGKALVYFGEPLKTGGTPINNYVVVSQPGNITSSGASSPIQLTGLTNSTNYTFKVVTSNVVGVSDTSIASNSVTPSASYAITTIVKNGNINVGPISVNVGGSYRVTYTATNNNYTIDSVIINNTNVIDSTNGYTFNNIGTNNTIRVVFKIKTAYLRLNEGINGINTPFGINQVLYGNNLRVNYVSNRGYIVDSIKINGIYYGGGVDSGSYTFNNILGDSIINITYKIQTNTITSSTNNVLGGNININNSVVNYGGSAVVSYAPNAGYYIDSVYINGVYNKDSLIRYTLNNITANQEVRVIFRGYEKPDSVRNVFVQGGNANAIITFTLPTNIKRAGAVKYFVTSTPENITASGTGSPIIITGLTNGTSYTFIVLDSNAYGSSNSSISNEVIPTNGLISILTSTGIGGVIQGSTNIDTSVIKTYRVTYTNQVGYILDSIFINGVYKGTDSNVGYTFKNIAGDSMIRVVYKAQTYLITSSVNNLLGGTISPIGVNSVVYGSSPQYTIIPNAGYNVDSIKVNNIKVGITNVYGFSNITAANTIIAYFSKTQYNIVSTVVNGTINPLGTRVVGYDTTIRYTYSGNAGYKLDSVIVNGEKIDSPTGYTFKNVRSNQTIRVKYKIPTYTITSISNGPATITPLGVIQVDSGGNANYNILGLTNIQIDSIKVNNI